MSLLLPAADDRLGWGRMLAMLGGLTILIFLYLALFVPGTLVLSSFVIQDDARQFHLWMARLVDPHALPGDRIADYWQAVSPPLYRLLFALVARLGIDPILFGRLLPAPLLAATIWAAWRLALQVIGNPRQAFIAAGFMLLYFVHEDSIYSASPRAFSPLLLLIFLHAMLGGRSWLALASLFLLGTLYPSSAVVGFGILVLRQIHRENSEGISISWRSLRLVAIAGATLAIAVIPFQTSTHHWGPPVTLDEALLSPNMATTQGRSSIVDDSGRIGWICNARMGFVPEIVPCHMGIPGAPIFDIALLLPLVILGWRALRRRPDDEAAERQEIYLLAFVAAAICFAAAAHVAFQLHLPSRYSQRILGPLEWLAIGQMLAAWRGRVANLVIGALLLISFATPTPGFQRPSDPELLRRIAALPRTVRIAGVSEELNAVPALTGRTILGATEQAIPWHTTYFAMVEFGLKQSLAIVSTRDPAQFADMIDELGASHILIERSMLATRRIPGRYNLVFPDAVARADQSLASGPPVIARHLDACATYSGPHQILLDARCLSAAARHASADDRP